MIVLAWCISMVVAVVSLSAMPHRRLYLSLHYVFFFLGNRSFVSITIGMPIVLREMLVIRCCYVRGGIVCSAIKERENAKWDMVLQWRETVVFGFFLDFPLNFLLFFNILNNKTKKESAWMTKSGSGYSFSLSDSRPGWQFNISDLNINLYF